MKGNSLLKKLRERFEAEPFTKYEARRVYDASGTYINEVFEKAKEVGILKPAMKCKEAYQIDPDSEGELRCSLEPDKPYDQSICVIVEELIDCSVREGPESPCDRLLEALMNAYQKQRVSSN